VITFQNVNLEVIIIKIKKNVIHNDSIYALSKSVILYGLMRLTTYSNLVVLLNYFLATKSYILIHIFVYKKVGTNNFIIQQIKKIERVVHK